MKDRQTHIGTNTSLRSQSLMDRGVISTIGFTAQMMLRPFFMRGAQSWHGVEAP